MPPHTGIGTLHLNKLRCVPHKNRLDNLFKLLSYANPGRVANMFPEKKRRDVAISRSWDVEMMDVPTLRIPWAIFAE